MILLPTRLRLADHPDAPQRRRSLRCLGAFCVSAVHRPARQSRPPIIAWGKLRDNRCSRQHGSVAGAREEREDDVRYPITLIPGDGIGPEISAVTKEIVAATGVEIEWHEMEAGAAAMEHYGVQLPEHVLQQIRSD